MNIFIRNGQRQMRMTRKSSSLARTRRQHSTLLALSLLLPAALFLLPLIFSHCLSVTRTQLSGCWPNPSLTLLLRYSTAANMGRTNRCKVNRQKSAYRKNDELCGR